MLSRLGFQLVFRCPVSIQVQALVLGSLETTPWTKCNKEAVESLEKVFQLLG